jgi:hypothetical protein
MRREILQAKEEAMAFWANVGRTDWPPHLPQCQRRYEHEGDSQCKIGGGQSHRTGASIIRIRIDAFDEGQKARP